MRKIIPLLLFFSICVPAPAATPGGAQDFLERAERLKAKGPFAFIAVGLFAAAAVAIGAM